MKIIPHRNKNLEQVPNVGLVPLRDAINRLFDESLWHTHNLFSRPSVLDSFFTGVNSLSTMQIDFSESDTEYSIVADVPGFSADDLDVELNDNVLVISGHKKDSKDEKEKTYHLQERSETHIKRSMILPDNCNLEAINCDIENGTLTIKVPKAEKRKGHKLKLNKK